MAPCLEEYKWYMVAFGTLSVASLLANVGFVIKYLINKEKAPENVTIPYSRGKGEVEMETFVMHIGGGRPGSSGVPSWAVKEYLSGPTRTSKDSSKARIGSTDA